MPGGIVSLSITLSDLERRDRRGHFRADLRTHARLAATKFGMVIHVE